MTGLLHLAILYAATIYLVVCGCKVIVWLRDRLG